MANAAIYARYSSHNQREASIEDQVRVCTEEAERRGDRVVRVYKDSAKSGRSADRPGFQLAMSEAKDGAWSVLYVYKEDRFARNRTDAAIYKGHLKTCGVRLVSAMEPMSDGPEGILMEALREALAEFTSANLAQNIRRGLEGNALKCGHNGCSCFGYDLGADGLYHVNEAERPYVVMAFEMYADGHSTAEIAEAFAPHKTRFGNPWSKNAIAKLLQNEKYAGVYVYGEHRVEGGVEAIVSRDLFDRVNAKLGRAKMNSYEYPLSGRLFDAEGRPFTGSYGTGKSGKRYYYYRVQETGESYRRKLVEDSVYSAVAGFLASDGAMREAIADAVLKVQGESMADEELAVAALESRLAELDREASNLLDLAAKTGASDLIASRLMEVSDERSTVEADLAGARAKTPKLTREILLELFNAIMAMDAPREIADVFVSRCVISDDRIRVYFNVRPEWAKDAATPAPADGEDGCSREVSLVELRVRHSNIIAVVAYAWGFEISVPWRRRRRR